MQVSRGAWQLERYREAHMAAHAPKDGSGRSALVLGPEYEPEFQGIAWIGQTEDIQGEVFPLGFGSVASILLHDLDG